MLPDEAQIFVQVLCRQKAARRNIVELSRDVLALAIVPSPEDRMDDGEFARDDRQILVGVCGVEKECASGQIRDA